MNKPNVIELLKEARKQLAVMHNHLMELSAKLPMQYFGLVDSGLIQNTGNLLTRIDAYLAKPEPDAMELVSKIREPTMILPIDVSMVREDLAITYQTNWKLTYSEAAALIEDYGQGGIKQALDSMARCERETAKHDVKLEG